MSITKLTDACCYAAPSTPANIRIALLKVGALFVGPTQFSNPARVQDTKRANAGLLTGDDGINRRCRWDRCSGGANIRSRSRTRRSGIRHIHRARRACDRHGNQKRHKQHGSPKQGAPWVHAAHSSLCMTSPRCSESSCRSSSRSRGLRTRIGAMVSSMPRFCTNHHSAFS